ncbi:hypothetical protein KQI88_10875 [Alkaliphilus sp. MSJ-5]|uniref:Apea-like HEPN domain-containing protein n=1 Tax=Alkaliphilus flagellatus TaxID=2841507 RepID=A0ABS6G664_9FIRM|nr:hypothetical protein [Alkaliphilus flagellatus]MBU5676920.1 hypothetical protein [Alkaliphilus flagellatus]
MFDENNERNKYDINIYYENLLIKEDFEHIKFLHKSEEKIVINDIKIKKKLAITKKSIGNMEELVKINPNLNVMNGYGYKIGDYIELNLYSFISVNLFDYYTMDGSITFNIGSVKILIEGSSEMYRWLKNLEYGYETYTDDYVITMSLHGITKENYADYFNMALFILWTIPKDYNKNTSVHEFITEQINDVNFEDVRFCEVFYFYNEAMRIIDTEISTLYFYKIIEYFFLVIRKDEFKNIIEDYIVDKNIDLVINKLVKIYKEQELSQLTLLLKSLEEEIGGLITKAVSLNIITSHDISKFAEALYGFRNSVVHGKSGEKFELKLPNPLIKNSKELFWRDSIKSIAEILIKKFCIKIL